jgi:hypothetical protein
MNEIEVLSCDSINNISDSKKYKKMEFTSGQKMQLSGLVQNLPSFAVNETLGKAYIVNMPKGVEGRLMEYKNGGYGSPIVGADNKIIAHASFDEINLNVAVMNAFSIMSVASNQYFLFEINKQLTALNQTIDKILEFLYSDKKAELISEVEFTKYAYENYLSIMNHNEQRLATITNLQAAKKIAMKDIEFYMSDLNDTVNSKDWDASAIADKALQIKSCLELSMQLYFISNVLEIYYSQNLDDVYIDWVEKTVTEYLIKCEKRILSNFSKLSVAVKEFKNPIKKIDKVGLLGQINTVIETLGGGTESEMCKEFREAVNAINSEKTFYIDDNSEVYLKVA